MARPSMLPVVAEHFGMDALSTLMDLEPRLEPDSVEAELTTKAKESLRLTLRTLRRMERTQGR